MAAPELSLAFSRRPKNKVGCLGVVSRNPYDTEIADVITSFDVNLEKQEVRVTGDAEYETVLAMIKKTGKTVLFGI